MIWRRPKKRRCPKREGDGMTGVQCEQLVGHRGGCKCPKALAAYLKFRFGKGDFVRELRPWEKPDWAAKMLAACSEEIPF